MKFILHYILFHILIVIFDYFVWTVCKTFSLVGESVFIRH